MERIKKGDQVRIVTGRDAADARREGRTLEGTVHRLVHGYEIDRTRRKVARDHNKDKVVVQGVNLVTKHQRRTGDVRTQVGRIEREAPIHISNVMLVCPACKEPTRVGFRIADDGSKSRFCKKCDELID